MTIKLQIPDIKELKPRITVFGVGGAGGNAVNNMINSGLGGVEFVVANTDAQALSLSKADRVIQLGVGVTEGLGAGSHPEMGRAAAEETIDEINDHLSGSHMAFITAGMGGGTGTGAAPIVARAAREHGILTVGVVTKPFQFEGKRRMMLAEDGISELHRHVDTLIVIPNQNLFRVANEKTTFADAFSMADEVLYSGVACVTDLMVKEGLINLDFADVRAVMRGMGKAMMGTGEAEGEDRARHAAEAAIANPLLDDVSMKGARGLLISITGGRDLTLYEVDEAASRIREEVDQDANIILGATFDDTLEGVIRVSVVATGTEAAMVQAMEPVKPNATGSPLSVKRTPTSEEAESFEAPAQPLETGMQEAVSEAIRAGSEPEAPALMHDEGIQVEPYFPEAEPNVELEDMPAPAEEPRVADTYVPPTAVLPEGSVRMPKTQEMPPIAREAMLAEADKKHADTPPRNARALFRRLASNVGLRARTEAENPVGDLEARSAVEAPPPPAKNTTPPDAPEGARGQLDDHGRADPASSPDRKSPEIPAFLRRHG
ncbi:MAG: cell division protein FtsZ [Alphaproteobacteria bacterium]|nr:cell division protein FtsZ [Alphaproteobacteria bacterium]